MRSTCFRIIGDEEVLYEMNLHAQPLPDGAARLPGPGQAGAAAAGEAPGSATLQRQPSEQQQQGTPSTSHMESSTLHAPRCAALWLGDLTVHFK
jgi:hypothetical protein